MSHAHTTIEEKLKSLFTTYKSSMHFPLSAAVRAAEDMVCVYARERFGTWNQRDYTLKVLKLGRTVGFLFASETEEQFSERLAVEWKW